MRAWREGAPEAGGWRLEVKGAGLGQGLRFRSTEGQNEVGRRMVVAYKSDSPSRAWARGREKAWD